MRVLMFGWELPPHISGGLGTACYGLTKGLSAYGDVEITFVVPKLYGDEDQSSVKLISASDIELTHLEANQKKKLEEFMNNWPYTKFSAYITPEQFEKLDNEKKERIRNSLRKSRLGKFGFSGKYGTGLYEEIYRYGIIASEIAKNEPHDIIHAHDWLTFEAGIEAKKISGKPLFVHIHATEFDRCGDNINKQVYEIEQYGMHYADKVITVSNYTRNVVIEKYNINPDKVIAIHNGVDINNAYINLVRPTRAILNDKIVTYLGRITFQKGPEYFINAACKVLQKMNNVRFVMAGSGDKMDDMIKYVARLGISNKFHFTGFLNGSEVKRMYLASDLYVMPSVSEPFGISPLEALQNNIPVIISKQSGVSEVLKHAIKIDFWDTDRMADIIYGILNYKALHNLLKNKGREEVMNLNWRNAAGKVRELYNNILIKKAG
ncbi:MAG: glycosyltransferase family 4 protein [Bacteroidales bacterium]|nr:glycosyltransferase family 4 protein [Bacteroidales bacterium]